MSSKNSDKIFGFLVKFYLDIAGRSKKIRGSTTEMRFVEKTRFWVGLVFCTPPVRMYIYTGGVSIAISRFRQALTLCYNEQTPNPYRWVWLTVVLANVKNKSS